MMYFVLNNALQFKNGTAREQWAYYIFADFGLMGITEAERALILSKRGIEIRILGEFTCRMIDLSVGPGIAEVKLSATRISYIHVITKVESLFTSLGQIRTTGPYFACSFSR